jgi:transposase-like protein
MPKNIPARFRDEAAARQHLEYIRWPDGPICPHCGVINHASSIKGGRKGLMFCNSCRKQFSVTVGTVFERSKIPLHLWLYANHLLCSSKKGVSAHQLHRTLGVTYKTAWFMAHRIREGMAPKNPPALGGSGQTVEVDETYIGRRAGSHGPGPASKIAVLSLVERGGQSRSFKVGKMTRLAMDPLVRKSASRKSRLVTDESTLYNQDMGFADHQTVNHSSTEYVRYTDKGAIHTNTVEGFFSIFKRGMKGIYQHCGEQHLQRYLNEFDFRYSHRVALGVDDATRGDIALQGIGGKRLTYRRTVQA